MENMKNIKIRVKTDKENKFLIICLWIMVVVVSKIMLLSILPDKYSRDGRTIFLYASSDIIVNDKGFDTASKFFSLLNKITHFKSFETWSIFLGLVGSIVLIYFIYDSLDQLFFLDFIILTSSIFLMNIYVFTVSKDIIQLLMFVPIIYILNKDYKEQIKIIGIMATLFLVAVIIRTYFALTAVIFLAIYKTFRSSYNQEKKKFWRNLVFIIIIGIVGLFILKSYAPLTYNQLSQARSDINQFRIGNDDAQTMIVDLIEDNGTIVVFMANLLINFFRLMFPFEMLKEGILQILFFIYQICLSSKLLILFYHSSKKLLSENAFISISLLIAYFIVAAAFEPDYGSAIRHEMDFFPIIYVALFEGEK